MNTMLLGFHRNICEREFKIFPSLFSALKKPCLAISNLAHLLLPHQDNNANAKPKELNPTLLINGFASQIFAHLTPLNQKVK